MCPIMWTYDICAFDIGTYYAITCIKISFSSKTGHRTFVLSTVDMYGLFVVY